MLSTRVAMRRDAHGGTTAPSTCNGNRPAVAWQRLLQQQRMRMRTQVISPRFICRFLPAGERMPSFPGQVWIEEEAAPATLLCRAREGFSAPFELRLCWALNRNLQPPLTVTMATIARMSRTRVAQIAQSRAISTTAARAAAINFTPLVGKVANDADKVRLPPPSRAGRVYF